MKKVMLWLFESLFLRLTAHMGRSGLILYGGGGGGGQTTSYTTNVPEFARESFMNMLGKAEALSEQPYQTFTGQRIQGFDPMQQRAFGNARSQTTAGQLGQATGLAAGAANASFTQPGLAGAFMSPYMQNVVDVQKREAVRDAGIANTQRNAQAVKAGAFGGSRQAVMDAEADRNLQTGLGDIQARGLQSAFESGQNQFNTEMGRRITGAQSLADIGQRQFGQEMDITQLLSTMGGQQQQLGQRQLDQQFNDFQAQREAPYQQLGFLADMLRGTGSSTRTVNPGASSAQTLAGLGTAAAGFGKMFAEGGEVTGYAEGGVVQPQQLTAQLAQMSDQGLQQYTEMHKDDPYTVALAVSESRRRQQLRQAAAVPEEAPQGSIVEREIEGMAEPVDMGLAAGVPDDAFEMADGGLVGYADGGDLDLESDPRIRALVADRDSTDAEEGLRPIPAFLRALMQGKTVEQVLAEQNAGLPSVSPRASASYSNEHRRTPAGITAAAPGAPLPPVPAQPQGIASTAPMPTPEAPQGAGLAAAAPTGAVSERGAVRTGGTQNTRGGLGALLPPSTVDATMQEGERRVGEMQDAERKALEEEQLEQERAFAQQGVRGEEREKRLRAQADGMGDRERDAKNMALIQAGLAILSADPSRGVAAAIGQGALAGLGAYKGDVQKLEGQRDKINEQLDQLLDLREQAENARGEKRAALRARIRTLEPAAKKATFELWRTVGLPMQQKEREMAFTAALKQHELDVSTENSRRQAAATVAAAQARGGAGPGGASDRALRDADAAFARDPEAKMLLQQAQGPMALMDPTQSQTIANKLRQIQQRYYQQYGITMTGPLPSAGQPPAALDLTKWGAPLEVTQ